MLKTPTIKLIGFDYLNEKEIEEIRRNLALLYETAEGTCPGDRHFGLSLDFQDAPLNVAINLYALEVIEKTEIYEDRVEILDIEYKHSDVGELIPKITIGIKEQGADEAI